MVHAKFTFVLDGQLLPFEPGQTIMEAACRAGVYIPHLCYHPDFHPHGSCKVCTVKENGHFGAACTLPAKTGVQVENASQELMLMRRRLVQMLFVEGNHHCSFCGKSGNCQLQAVAYQLNMQELHYPLFNPGRELDASHPDMVLDRDRCIQCALCVQASHEQDGKDVFGIGGRGMDTRLMINSESGRLGESRFSRDDRAAHICPTGALMAKDQAYAQPIGQRLYDKADIAQVGNTQPQERKRG